MSNLNPLQFTPENRGKKPKLIEGEKSITFSVAYPESMYKFIKSHGCSTYIRKLLYTEMLKETKVTQA